MKGFLSSLEKADFQEHLHPRARTGKFAKKPAKVGVGAIGAVGGMKVRAAQLPIHLRRATPAEWKKEKQRIAEMTPAQLQTRMNKIGVPQKMKSFAEALEEANLHSLSAEAFKRLRAMGFERDGAPVGMHYAPETSQQPIRPPPVRRPPQPRDPLANIPQKPVPSPAARKAEMQRRGAAFAEQEANRRRLNAIAEERRKQDEEEAKRAAASPQVLGERTAIKTVKEDLEKMTTPGALVEARSLNEENRERYSGKSFRVKSADGKKAVWKPKVTTGLDVEKYPVFPGQEDKGDNGIRHNIDARIPEFERELAAYRFSEEMGMGVVPPVIKASIPIGEGGEGHLVGWEDGEVVYKYNKYYDDARKGHTDLQRIAALDFIVGNTDRHQNNFMRGKDGHYYAIDDGLVFPRDSKLTEDSFRCDIFGRMHLAQVSPQVKTEVERLTPEKITSIMKEGGFFQEDIDGVIARREVFLGMKSFADGLDHRAFMAAASIARTIKMERMAEEAVRRSQ